MIYGKEKRYIPKECSYIKAFQWLQVITNIPEWLWKHLEEKEARLFIEGNNLCISYKDCSFDRVNYSDFIALEKKDDIETLRVIDEWTFLTDYEEVFK